MFYVYILKSKSQRYYYIGYTQDLRQRIKDHNQGKTRSLKSKIPIELVYYEAYNTKTQARKREYELKNNSYKKREIIERIESDI
ncbi:MAG: GIY-YIG nuclease family protein [Candidatus Moraniibacteriota bacterium]|nr:MAG: GIY-YIG nuclease family protein [Candidatus Moranbacteria bacterium]